MWRNGLLYKLAKHGIGQLLFQVIKNQYTRTEIAIKFNNSCSTFFETYRGVRQGDSISPTLFNIFINDLEQITTSESSMSPKLVESKVGSLLFADDLVILSESKEGLQNSVNNLGVFCDDWKLTLNIDKTKSMVIQQNSSHKNEPFVSYKNNLLQNVTEYRFLGTLLKNNGNLNYRL